MAELSYAVWDTMQKHGFNGFKKEDSGLKHVFSGSYKKN